MIAIFDVLLRINNNDKHYIVDIYEFNVLKYIIIFLYISNFFLYTFLIRLFIYYIKNISLIETTP